MVSDASQANAAEPAPARKRVRDPEARRAAILAAARSVFAERGYAKATIREIAQRAGVTHGLVVMHFSSKEQLFLAAVPGTRDLGDSVRGDADGLAERVARAYVARMESADSADPFIALVRSAAGDQEAAKALLRAMREESIATYRTVLTGQDVALRVDLLGAHLIGITFSRYVLADGPIAAMSADELTRYLTMTLDGILFGSAGATLSSS
ncbi:TetR family transcriptional regulator [Microbispora sp. NEAU-D428]|uniref:TetR/AcrR family transcriptional regulator n=1 Tax=Microbispora sitophila TaxID=2771537 RepID=UPI0018694CFB|nr:TetR family transcriptional regulator [Microbispora sitophila]MBE3010348.1 TetR family transcriptional regulator [Microbispora sitophila]